MKKDKVPYIVVVILTLLIVFILYLFHEAFPSRKDSVDAWLNTAAIINGLITPILTLAGVVLIWFTWQTSKKELEATNEVLELDKAVKIFTAMIDATNKLLNKRVTSKQISKVFNLIVKEWHDGDYKGLQVFENNDENSILNEKFKLLIDPPKYTHLDLMTNFGRINVANVLPLEPFNKENFLDDALKFHLINMYTKRLDKEDRPSPINKVIIILEYIQLYKSNEMISDTLVNLFLFNIEDSVLEALAKNPSIKAHPIFKKIVE
jgi:hypothetical protein